MDWAKGPITRFELTLLPSCQRCLNFLNNLITGIIFLTLIVNIIKSAFGTQRSWLLGWMFQPRRDLNVVSNQKRLDYLNNVATGVIFVTTVTNFFVSFFGSKRTGFFRWLLARLHF
ncbi:unnamed protein product [Pleuronectes platessa]|uniref:Ninjurin 2 n=1 Tax=Pleuronectes platessa TaxID=8262 RepID=A0A9N7VVT8_PLEPL|nr:unnamed protein product [Pleuronectes platessa]